MSGRRRLGALLVCSALAGLGCSSVEPPETPRTLGERVAPGEVKDADFSASLMKILLDGSMTETREALLLGVVKRQLVHAGERFDRGSAERGTRSVLGALYLMRVGEESPRVIDQETKRAIDGSVVRLSARGDIGRARVLIALQAHASSKEQLKELDAHIVALERFRSETQTGRPIERAGDAQRTAFGRAILDPSGIDEAVRASSAWIDLAIQHNILYQQTGKRPHPDEIPDIARALEAGALSVIALMLRYGDIAGAMDRIASSSAKRVIDPQFFGLLAEVEKRNSASSYRELFDAIRDQAGDRIGGEMGIDAELYEAARFVVAIEAYRREPAHLATASELASLLTSFGMSEAVPAVLAGALKDGTPPGEVARAMRLFAGAVAADADTNDAAAAARTIAASDVFLERAKSLLPEEIGKRAVAELRYEMASVLLKGGFSTDAEKLLSQAIEESPRPSGLVLRARLERQSARSEQALADVAAATAIRAAKKLDVADARLLEFEIRRDQNRPDEAKAALADALKHAQAACDEETGRGKVAALGVLGRVLNAYGDRDGARKAFERALEHVSGDRDLFGSIMLRAASSAFVLNDADGVRAVLRRGVDAGAPQEDLVHGALWLMFVEKQAGKRADEDARDILDAASSQPSWSGQLAAWGRGRLSDEALKKRASNEASRVAADFYLAMAKRSRGGSDDDALRLVAESRVIQSMEVQIARDLLAPRLPLAVPKGVKIP